MKYSDKDRQNADKVADMVNTFIFNYDGFCNAMCDEHRTLQQSFTKLCIEWLKTCARDEYRHDARNEYSHRLAKEIATAYDHNHTETSVEFFQDINLPMV